MKTNTIRRGEVQRLALSKAEFPRLAFHKTSHRFGLGLVKGNVGTHEGEQHLATKHGITDICLLLIFHLRLTPHNAAVNFALAYSSVIFFPNPSLL